MSQDESINSNAPSPSEPARAAMARRVAVGAFLGLAWSASLRAWMTTLALEFGERPQFSWTGTFGAILIPATLAGAALGMAAHLADTSSAKRWRWLILSPLLLTLVPVLVLEDFIPTLLATGLGGGAIAVTLVGLLGGYGFSGFGPVWLRWISGLLGAALAAAMAYALYFGGGAVRLEADKVFGALLFVSLMVLLIAGVSAPSRYQHNLT